MDYLRRDVAVRPTAQVVGLRFGYWSLDLPRDWVSATDGMAAFLSMDAPLSTVDLGSVEARNVAGMLRLAGCLTIAAQDTYTLAEVRALFLPLCMSWHARYYAHPFWSRLREGRASRNALVTWILHTYHLSQSAGVTAARCVARSTRPDVQRLFLESAAEEYSHCRDYYAVDDPRLGLAPLTAQDIVPLSANLAFDQQMLRLAEEDWLAHILVGYFQESTANYYDQCVAFYDAVEQRYGLAGYFDGWKAHMRLDLDFGHASAFDDALAGDEPVSDAQVRASLANAAFTVQWLVRALDAIDRSERTDDVVVPRYELRADGEGPAGNALLAGLSAQGVPASVRSARNAAELAESVLASGLLARPAAASFLTIERQAFVVAELGASFCRAMGSAGSERQLLCLGRLTEITTPALRGRIDSAAWCATDEVAAAVMNVLREAATTPAEFSTSILLMLDWLGGESTDHVLLDPEVADQARRLAEACPVHPGEIGRLVTRLIQFGELWREPDSTAARAIVVDVIR